MVMNEKEKREALLKSYGESFPRIPYEHFRNLMFALPIVLNAKVVVETGVSRGHSTEIFLRALQYTQGTLWSYDIERLESTIKKLNEKGLTDRWIFKQMDSVEAGKEWGDKYGYEIPLLYLDSNHAKSHVLNELRVWTPYVRNVILIHDTAHPRGVEDPARSLEAAVEFVEKEHKWRFVNLNDGLGMGLLWKK